MIPAIRGEWWQAEGGQVYCVVGPTFGSRGRGAMVECYWITNHAPPQVHNVKFYVGQWRALTTKGARLDGPPSHNDKGCSFGPAVARVAEMMGAS